MISARGFTVTSALRAYNDAIMMVGCLFVAGLFLMPLVNRPRVAGAAGH